VAIARSIGSASGMVVTPWGSSESLRERMLRPGPGSHNDEVAQNQRERVFGAVVASVSERGYAATRISDLVELSGVSSRTFYDLFGDKERCFLEAVEAAVAIAVQAVAEVDAANREASWKERAIADLRVFAETIASQPAAARVCLIEAYAAGPKVLERLDAGVAEFERVAQQIRLRSPERTGMPAEMMTVHVGALQEIVRNRLRRDAAAELPGLMEEVAKVLFSLRPPPEPLRLITRPPSPRAEDLDAHSHAERAMRAFAVVVAEKGYALATMDEVSARASMSPTTLYANFSGKEDLLMSTIDSAGAQIVAAVLPAFERSSDWPSSVRAAYGALFSFLATRPALAHLMSVGVHGGGVSAMERRDRALAPLGALIERGRPAHRFQPPPITPEVIAGAIYGLTYRHVRTSGPEVLPTLAPLCTYLTLAPYLGTEEATKSANGDGRRRGFRWPEKQTEQEARYRTGERLLSYIATRTVSLADLATYLGEAPETVAVDLAALQRGGMIEVSTATGPDGRIEELYSAPHMVEILPADWERVEFAERQEISAQIQKVIDANMNLALEAGTFDARSDRHLSHSPVRLDEQGWKEIAAVLYTAFGAVKKASDESSARQLEAGDGGIEARVVLSLFEMPSVEGEPSTEPAG
jgi:AcrR family transcriptional regulator